MSTSLSTPSPVAPSRNWWTLPIFIVVVYVVAAIGALANIGMPDDWYRRLQAPPLTPPNSIFGPVWSVLYILMATAAWLVWEQRANANVRWPLAAFVVQLLLNAAWSPLFFGAHRIDLALLDLIAMWIMIVVTMFTFAQVSRWAAMLLVPYLLWVTFAGYLNAGFWWLNG